MNISIRTKFVIVFLFWGACHHFAAAQCSFDLDVRVIQQSTCVSNGIIEVRLSGDEIDTSNVLISLNHSNGNINLLSTTNGFQFTTLPSGEYVITVKTACKNQSHEIIDTQHVVIQQEYASMNAILDIPKRSSLNCENTGMLSFEVWSGKPSYQIIMQQKPAGYSGDTVFLRDQAGKFQIENLAAGDYFFSFTDECLFHIEFPANVAEVVDEFPTGIFVVDSADNFCTTYQYTFGIDGTVPCMQWEIFTETNILVDGGSSTYFNKLNTGELLYGKDYTITLTDNRGNRLTETFGKPIPPLDHELENPEYDCVKNTYRLCYHLLCAYPPLKHELFNADSTPISSAIVNSNRYCLNNLTAEKEYIITVTDSLGRVISFPYSFKKEIEIGIFNYSCHYYDLSVKAEVLCDKYDWILLNEDSVILKQSTESVDPRDIVIIDSLQYDSVYILILKQDTNIVYYEKHLPEMRPEPVWAFFEINAENPYQLDFMPANIFCFPYKWEIFDSEDTLVASRSGINMIRLDTAQLPCGEEYTVRITDAEGYEIERQILIRCSDSGGENNDSLTPCSAFEVRDFSYDKDEDTDICQGITRVYPQGKMYKNGEPVTTLFTLIETPDGSGVGTVIDSENLTAYFSFIKNGRHVITVSEGSSRCADTFVINHTQKSFGLEWRSSYVCEPDGLGHLRAQAKNGKEPYTYELQDLKGNSIPIAHNPNNTGMFECGRLNEIYTIKISDACNKSFPIEVQITTLDQIPLLSGNNKLCAGGDISFICLLIGATEYEWTGVNGFSSTRRMINIPDVRPENSGNYTIRVQPVGCNNLITETVWVEVRDARPPVIQDTIYVCNTETPYRFSVNSDHGYSVHWYDSNKNPLDTTPVADLNMFPEYVFYALQTENELGCTSDTVKIVVTNNVPESAIQKTCLFDGICEGDSLFFGSGYLTMSGIYVDTFLTATGCDSLVILQFEVYQAGKSDTTVTARGSYDWHGNTYFDSGIYSDTIAGYGGCDSVLILNLTILSTKIRIPNVITPDGYDGNEVFAIINLDIELENHLIVYDRWGRMVFNMKNYPCVYDENSKQIYNADRAFTAKNLADSVYYYVFHYDNQIYNGSLTVIRKR